MAFRVQTKGRASASRLLALTVQAANLPLDTSRPISTATSPRRSAMREGWGAVKVQGPATGDRYGSCVCTETKKVRGGLNLVRPFPERQSFVSDGFTDHDFCPNRP